MDTQFNTHEQQEHLLDAKERILGSIQSDRVGELSDIEYLKFEIQETSEKRRSLSMPLFAIGMTIGFFSMAAKTTLTEIAGVSIAALSLFFAIRIATHYTKRLRQLRKQLSDEEAKQAIETANS